MVTVCPATTSVPVRVAPLGFGATVNETPAEPMPLVVVGSTVIQDALLLAVQEQPFKVVTATLAAPPAEATARLVGDTLNVHDEPACVTVMTAPAIVAVPVRLCDVGLDATVNVTLPESVPPEAPSEIHDALELAVQAHPLSV